MAVTVLQKVFLSPLGLYSLFVDHARRNHPDFVFLTRCCCSKLKSTNWPSHQPSHLILMSVFCKHTQCSLWQKLRKVRALLWNNGLLHWALLTKIWFGGRGGLSAGGSRMLTGFQVQVALTCWSCLSESCSKQDMYSKVLNLFWDSSIDILYPRAASHHTIAVSSLVSSHPCAGNGTEA